MVMHTEVKPLDSLIPYWRNPRRVTDEAVNAVMESIRVYGYQQPIVVDTENVIVVGHTRYAALRRLGYKEAEVNVLDLPPQKIKQLRVLDNRTSEYATWDFDKLASEMGDLDMDLMTRFFPEVANNVFEVVQQDVDAPVPDPSLWEPVEVPADGSSVVEFVCPSCFHMFDQKVTREEVFAGVLSPTTQEETA